MAMLPPSASTIRRAMVRPRPVPPVLRFLDASSRVNGSKARAISWGRDAGAVVVDRQQELFRLDGEGDAGGGPVAHGVVDDVVERASQGHRADRREGAAWTRIGDVAARIRRRVGDAHEDAHDVRDLARFGIGVAPKVRQSRIDHGLHVVEVRAHRPGLVVLGQAVEPKAKPRDGGAQVVRDGGQGLGPLRHQPMDAVLHRVEGPGDPAGLVGAGLPHGDDPSVPDLPRGSCEVRAAARRSGASGRRLRRRRGWPSPSRGRPTIRAGRGRAHGPSGRSGSSRRPVRARPPGPLGGRPRPRRPSPGASPGPRPGSRESIRARNDHRPGVGRLVLA